MSWQHPGLAGGFPDTPRFLGLQNWWGPWLPQLVSRDRVFRYPADILLWEGGGVLMLALGGSEGGKVARANPDPSNERP